MNATVATLKADRASSVQDRIEHWLATKLNFGDQDRERLWKRLAHYTSHGYQLKTALQSQLRRYGRDADLRRVVWRRWLDSMAEGLKFSDVIARYAPPSEVLMISAGEESGKVSEGFDAAAYVARNTRRLKTTLVKALAYPLLLSSAAVGMLFLIASSFAPAMLDMSPNRAGWPAISQLLYLVATTVHAVGIYVVIVAIVVLFVAFRSLPGWTGPGRAFCDRFVPPFSVYREFQSATFVLSLSALVASGRPVREALEHMVPISTRWLRTHIQRMLRSLAEGIAPGEAIRTGLINREVMGMIEDYGEAAPFDSALTQIGKDIVDDALEAIENAAGKVLIIVLLAVAALVVLAYGGMLALAFQIAVQIKTPTF